jgi:acyl-CoA thioesterase-2
VGWDEAHALRIGEDLAAMSGSGIAMDFAAMMAVEDRGADRFSVTAGPGYPWGVLYGGQVVAQALRAAASTVGPDRLAHSLHAYYIGAGNDRAPIELSVERVRDGRSFSVRAVTASQEAKTLMTMSVSFHVDERAEDLPATAPPAVPRPDDLPPGGWSHLFDRRYAPPEEPGRTRAWLRLHDAIGDDPTLQAGALAFLADDIPDDAVLALLAPERPPANDLESHDWSISTQSLDYALWFHRPIRADGWRLHDLSCRSLANACAMVTGELFDEQGTHLATLGQQVLVREGKR